jgi:DNA polymerase III subunit delta
MAARLTPDRLPAALAKGPAASAYYLFGGEPILKDQALAALIDGVLDPGLRDFNLDLLSATQVEPDGLAAACSTLPMMAERRVVVLRDVEAWKRKTRAKTAAVTYLEHPAPETVLVMVQGNGDKPDADLARHAVAVDCDAPTGAAFEKWLDARLKSAGVVLDHDARTHLVRATGGELGLIAAEIDKLSGLEADGPINRDTVGALVGVRFGETPEDWRDAVLGDDTARAVALVPRLLEISGNSGVRLVTLLGSSLILTGWARATGERKRLRGDALARAVADLCFRTRPSVGSYSAAARVVAHEVARWPVPRVRAAIASALAADMALKNTGVSDETGIVTDLVLALAAPRVERAA